MTGDLAPKYPVGRHPNSLANLRRPWQPHESGNPAGRDVNAPVITPHLRRFAQMPVPAVLALDESKLTMAEAIARARYLRALDKELGWRDTAAIEDRLDGKVALAIDLSHKEDESQFEARLSALLEEEQRGNG